MIGLLLASCAGTPFGRRSEPPMSGGTDLSSYDYLIGPGDRLDIFVWRNPEVSVQDIPVRPDGKISSPLVGDLRASGKTAAQLADDIRDILVEYIKDPRVSVTVKDFVGEYAEQIRVVGEATQPQSLPYSKNMTLLDVMIAVGGLTEFADGNKATLIRTNGGTQQRFHVRLEDLVKDGDITANVEVLPGDILIIPESWF